MRDLFQLKQLKNDVGEFSSKVSWRFFELDFVMHDSPFIFAIAKIKETRDNRNYAKCVFVI